MLRLFSPVRLLVAGLLVAAAVGALWLIPTGHYIFLPNRTHEVAPLVEVEGRPDRDEGRIYFVDVRVRPALLAERLFPGLREGATIVPESQVRPPGVSEQERRQEELREMRRSQQIAAAVALQELGYDVVAQPMGARVEFVDPEAPAGSILRTGDVIVAVEGRDVSGPEELRRMVRRRGVGATLTLALRREGRRVAVDVETIRGPQGGPIIGVVVSQAANIRLPLEVEIDARNVGGPSAGLAFALGLMEELGRDVDRGARVAVTGSLDLDGTVGQVGGLKQKTIAVRRAGLDAFVVPTGANAQEARRHADGLRVVPVASFEQALRALATLRPDEED